jgi:hypothetical protein
LSGGGAAGLYGGVCMRLEGSGLRSRGLNARVRVRGSRVEALVPGAVVGWLGGREML